MVNLLYHLLNCIFLNTKIYIFIENIIKIHILRASKLNSLAQELSKSNIIKSIFFLNWMWKILPISIYFRDI